MSFSSLRLYVLLSSIVGLLLGGLLGAFVGRNLNPQWGDLAGVVTGIWLGGPLAALITFQYFIGKLDLDLFVIRARITNLLISFAAVIILLSIFAVSAGANPGSILLAPTLIFANLALSYFNLILSIRTAKK